MQRKKRSNKVNLKKRRRKKRRSLRKMRKRKKITWMKRTAPSTLKEEKGL